MEKTIIITALVVTITIYIVLRIVRSYIRELDRVRNCVQMESKRCSSITQTYIDSLNKQIRTLIAEVTRLSLDNVVKEGEIRRLKKELEMANKERSGE